MVLHDQILAFFGANDLARSKIGYELMEDSKAADEDERLSQPE